MEENKKKFDWKFAGFIAVFIMLIISLAKINDLSNEISNLQGVISGYQNQVNNLRSDINSIYDNVDEKLKKEASLLSSVDYSLGELNTETHMIPVTLNVVPKNITDDMKLSVRIGSETVALERKENEFSATFPVNMFIAYDDYPILNIVSGEITRTEKLEDVYLSELHAQYLPNIYAHLESSESLKNGKLTIDGVLMFDEKPVSIDSDITATQIELVTVKNNQEINCKDITEKVKSSYHHVPVNVTYDAKYGDEVSIYVIAKDSLGYTHKVRAYCWYQVDEDSDSQIVDVGGSATIYDKNGNLLTGGNE